MFKLYFNFLAKKMKSLYSLGGWLVIIAPLFQWLAILTIPNDVVKSVVISIILAIQIILFVKCLGDGKK